MSVRASAQTYDFAALKKGIYEALAGLSDSLDINRFKADEETVAKAYRGVLDEHPELFYVNGFYKYHFYESTGKVTKILFVYCAEKDQIPRMKKELDSAARHVISKMEPGLSDFEKVLFFHEYLTVNTAYDYVSPDSGKNSLPLSFTAYGALVRGLAVCDGYSTAFKLLCDRTGVDAQIVRSKTMNHSWNIVKLDGRWYHLDVTWDDPVDLDVEKEMPGYVSHKYFLLSDTGISSDHYAWESGVKAPVDFFGYSLFQRSVDKFFFTGGSWFCSEDGDLKIYDMKDLSSKQGPLKNAASSCGENGVIYASNANDIFKYSLDEQRIVKIYSSDDDIFRVFIDDRSDSLMFTSRSDIYSAKRLKEFNGEFLLNPFEDVPNASWFAGAAVFCRSRGYVYGVGDTLFAPGGNMTRAMIVTVLGKIAGIDASEYTGTSFGDVEPGMWYSPYVEWAYQNGITAGYGDIFGTNDGITREQMYTMLRGFAEYRGEDTAIGDTGAIGGFDDAGAVSGWARESIVWAYENGLMSGSDNKIMPQGLTTRAQTAVICWAYVK